jgi:hypothetical protein
MVTQLVSCRQTRLPISCQFPPRAFSAVGMLRASLPIRSHPCPFQPLSPQGSPLLTGVNGVMGAGNARAVHTPVAFPGAGVDKAPANEFDRPYQVRTRARRSRLRPNQASEALIRVGTDQARPNSDPQATAGGSTRRSSRHPPTRPSSRASRRPLATAYRVGVRSACTSRFSFGSR